MEGADSNHLDSNEEREEKVNQLWQNFTDAHGESVAKSVTENTAVGQWEGANQEDFWAKYTEVLAEAKKKQEANSLDKALTLMDDVFLSNLQQFKSVTIPIGKYFYTKKGLTRKAKHFAKLGAGWGAHLLLMLSGFYPEELYPMLFMAQVGTGIYTFSNLYKHLTQRDDQDIAIESSYIVDKPNKQLLAFKDINHIEETDKGLLVQDIRKQNNRRYQLLIPHNAEEYVNIKRFLKQVEAVNLQQANVYPNIPALRKGYWHDQALVSFGKPKRFLIQKKSIKGIGNIPTDWAAIFGGIATVSIASFSTLGLPFVGFLGIVGAAHALDTFKHKKRFSFNALHIADEYIQYVFNYNHKTHIIKIPLDEVYGVKKTYRGFKILDIKGGSYWKTDAPPHKKFQPIIPKKMHGVETIKIFLEEVATHNQSLL